MAEASHVTPPPPRNPKWYSLAKALPLANAVERPQPPSSSKVSIPKLEVPHERVFLDLPSPLPPPRLYPRRPPLHDQPRARRLGGQPATSSQSAGWPARQPVGPLGRVPLTFCIRFNAMGSRERGRAGGGSCEGGRKRRRRRRRRWLLQEGAGLPRGVLRPQSRCLFSPDRWVFCFRFYL